MLNKTPKENEKKTKSARKAAFVPLLIFLVIFSGLMIFSLTRESDKKNDTANTSTDQAEKKSECVQIGPECITFEYADTNQERIKGLSDRDGLPEKGGMLFVFDNTEEQCMWMKDMKFSLDMIWLDTDKKILKIVPDAKPESYPETFCADNTKFVVELNAGTAANAGLQQGQTLNF